MLDQVLSRLNQVRKIGNRYTALCPCHSERTPSLSIREIAGRVACRCFGCGAGTRAVYAAIGLAWGAHEEPVSDFLRALTMGRQQQAYRHRRENRVADLLRQFDRVTSDLRVEATALGPCDEAWDLLAEVAAHERLVWAVTA